MCSFKNPKSPLSTASSPLTSSEFLKLLYSDPIIRIKRLARHLLIVTLECRQILACLLEFALLHTLANVPEGKMRNIYVYLIIYLFKRNNFHGSRCLRPPPILENVPGWGMKWGFQVLYNWLKKKTYTCISNWISRYFVRSCLDYERLRLPSYKREQFVITHSKFFH